LLSTKEEKEGYKLCGGRIKKKKDKEEGRT
jgi:hypothetical protein